MGRPARWPLFTATATIATVLSPALSAQPTTYTYAGDAYTTAGAPYSVGGDLEGTLTTASPLPPFLRLTDITPWIESFSFSDDVETRTLADSFVCAFDVATDGAGRITRWSILLRRSPYNPGDPHHAIDSSGAVGVIQGADLAGTGTAGAGPCDGMALSPFASTATQGAWVSDQPLPTDPTTYTYAGAAYTTANGPYTLGGTLQGTLSLANPLPAFLPLTDISPAIESFSFSDEVEARTDGDSFVCGFQLATDGAGEITEWSIALRRSPFNSGDPHHAIESSGAFGVIQGSDLGGTGTAGAGPCDAMALSPFASTSVQGIWVSDHSLPTDPTTYTYTGDPYTTATAPYALGGTLQGTLTLPNPLPPFLPLTDITPAIESFSFSDDVEARTAANSFVCGFEVATDGAGEITAWSIALRRSPFNPGDPHHAIETSGAFGVIQGSDLGGAGTAGAGPCDGMALSPFASTSGQGTWVSDHSLPTDPTTYTYTGDPYTTADPPYALGGALQGTLTLANPLPPFLPLTDISPAIESFSFADEVEARTAADSFVCGFEVATDGAGRITRWLVSLRRSPFSPGDPHHAIDSTGLAGVIEGDDTVGTGTAPAGPCDLMALAPFAGSSSQGAWIGEPAASVLEVPALAPLGASLLALSLAGFAMLRLRSQRLR